jgi:pSer/pThr/pTyr-binding forkhead associated (FHA) protein
MPDDGDRTIIQRPAPKPTDGAKDDGSTSKDAPTPSNSSRKLVGWLVSFSHDPFGTDYRLYEGQNKVGRDAMCSVRIVHDKSISSNHATILFRNGNFYVKDEMAANPSFVNKIEIKPGATEEIQDGDTIEFGATTLLFRKAFI